MSDITSVALQQEEDNVTPFPSKQGADFSFKVDTNNTNPFPFIITLHRKDGSECHLRLDGNNLGKFISTLVAMKDYKNSF